MDIFEQDRRVDVLTESAANCIQHPNHIDSHRSTESISKRRTIMSEQNVSVVRGMYEAFGEGNIPGVLGSLDPNVEWLEAENFIYAAGNPYVGPDAVLQGVFMRIGTEWENFTVSPKEILDAGDTIVAHGYYAGTYKATGRQVRAQFAHLFYFRDGKIVKFQQYTDTAQFQEAVGDTSAAAMGAE